MLKVVRPLKKIWAKVESNQTYPEFTCYVTFSYIVYLVVDMCYPKYVNSFIIYSIMISIINQVNAIAFSLRWLCILFVKRQKQAYTVLLSQGSQEYRHMKTERSIYDKKKHTTNLNTIYSESMSFNFAVLIMTIKHCVQDMTHFKIAVILYFISKVYIKKTNFKSTIR